MEIKQKFKSRISPAIIAVLTVYHMIIAVLFILPLFLYRDVTTGFGIFLLSVDAVFLFPLIFNTYYALGKDALLVCQWPFTRKSIKYCDIFEISDVLPDDKRNLKKVSLSKNIVVIGYYKYDENGKKKTKHYLEISPRDLDLFLIKMGGKFSNARALAKKLEEEHKIKNAEHFEKKKIADKKRQAKEEANKPVDVVVAPKKKTDIKK